jgi:hypothetical protein
MKHVSTFFPRSRTGLAFALLAAAAPAWAQGLTFDETALLGPRLQARVGLNASAPPTDGANVSWQQQGGVLLGDYYFSRARLGDGRVSSGFRATSGVLFGQRSLALGTPAVAAGPGFGLTVMRQPRVSIPGLEAAAEPWSAVPYVGVGWSGASLRGGWEVSADFGFAGRSQGDGGLRVSGSQSLDDLLRELRITPMVQIGVSYAF